MTHRPYRSKSNQICFQRVTLARPPRLVRLHPAAPAHAARPPQDSLHANVAHLTPLRLHLRRQWPSRIALGLHATRSHRRTDTERAPNATLDRLRWRSLTWCRNLPRAQHLGPAALSGGIIDTGKSGFIQPCAAGRSPPGSARRLARVPSRIAPPSRRVAAVVLGSRNIDLSFQVRRERSGLAGASVADRRRESSRPPEAIRIGSPAASAMPPPMQKPTAPTLRPATSTRVSR